MRALNFLLSDHFPDFRYVSCFFLVFFSCLVLLSRGWGTPGKTFFDINGPCEANLMVCFIVRGLVDAPIGRLIPNFASCVVKHVGRPCSALEVDAMKLIHTNIRRWVVRLIQQLTCQVFRSCVLIRTKCPKRIQSRPGCCALLDRRVDIRELPPNTSRDIEIISNPTRSYEMVWRVCIVRVQPKQHAMSY